MIANCLSYFDLRRSCDDCFVNEKRVRAHLNIRFESCGSSTTSFASAVLARERNHNYSSTRYVKFMYENHSI